MPQVSFTKIVEHATVVGLDVQATPGGGATLIIVTPDQVVQKFPFPAQEQWNTVKRQVNGGVALPTEEERKVVTA